jgi:hypothetical protein
LTRSKLAGANEHGTTLWIKQKESRPVALIFLFGLFFFTRSISLLAAAGKLAFVLVRRILTMMG